MSTLEEIRALRKEGRHEDAHKQLLELAKQYPHDPVIQYETACVHDYLGFEADAVPYYQSAIQNGLSGEDLRSAYLGLGSTFRALGRYTESKGVFLDGLKNFPEANEIKVFLAMTLYNLGEHHEAVSSLLKVVTETTSDTEIKSYERAILFYADDLNKAWES